MESPSFQRICPTCNKEILYSRHDTLKRAAKENRRCSSCCLIGNTHTKGRAPINKGKISVPVQTAIDNQFIYFNNRIWYRKCPTCKNPVKCSSYYNAYKRLSVCCHSCGILKNVGSNRSLESRKKMSESAIRRIQKYQLYNKPNFNPDACKFIDDLNVSFGLNLQHALNGGEIWIDGFYPDGYDKEKNVVFEYDESWHQNTVTKSKDLKRQQTIVDQVKPLMFIRYDEKTETLYDVISNEKF